MSVDSATVSRPGTGRGAGACRFEFADREEPRGQTSVRVQERYCLTHGTVLARVEDNLAWKDVSPADGLADAPCRLRKGEADGE